MSALGEPSTLTLTYPAIPESVPDARHALVGFAESAEMDPEQIEALCLAASEAITNVVRHAYGADGGLVYVTAALAGEELWVLIGDDGHGLQTRTRSQSPGLGMGLALIASVSDHFSVVRRSSGGTEVRMRFAVGAKRSPERPRAQARGSVSSATAPASARFSTIT